MSQQSFFQKTSQKVIVPLFTRLGIPTKGLGFEFIKNTSWVTFATVLGNVMSYVLVVLLTRFLGAEGLGQYSFVLAFSTIFFIFSDWGLSPLLLKDLSRDFKKADKYISNILTFKSLLLFISLIIYVLVVFFIQKENLLLSLIVIGFLQVSSQLSGFARTILRVKNKGAAIAYGIFFERLFALIVGGLLLFLYQSLLLFIFALFLAQALRMLIYFFFSRNYFRYVFSLDWSFLFNLIKKGYPFILVSVFALIYGKMDTIMLSFMRGDVVTGWYNAGYKLIETLGMITVLLLTFGFPLFSKLYAENKDALRKLLENILYYALVLIFPIVIGVFFLSSRILDFLYGFSSIEASFAFKILIVAQIFIFLSEILGVFIASVDKQIIFAKIAGFGAILNIILNFLLIPAYSLYGAAFATGITYLFMFISMNFYTRKKIINFHIFRRLVPPTLASLGLYFLIPYLLFLNLFLIIGISAVVYFAVFFAIDFLWKKHVLC
jgi:O-antigen/teichoic acid export membrane protein